MTDRLFRRTARVTCWRENIPDNPTQFSVNQLPGPIEITDLRIQFHVRRDLSKHPNACDITITNLSTDTRHNLETKPLNVQLEAGYDGVPRLLFVGDLRFGMTKLQGPNWETLLQLGDGDCHHRWSRVSKTYPANTSVRTMIKDAVASMGLTMPANLASDKTLDEQVAYGDVAHGPVRDRLVGLLAPYGYTPSLQNGKLVVLADNQITNIAPVAIDEEHGMIGTPEFGSPPKSGKPPHMHVKMLLYPELSPGQLVNLTSKVKSGTFRIEKVDHHGDTHGRPWETEIEIKPMPAPATAVTTSTITATGTAIAGGGKSLGGSANVAK